MQNIYGFPTIDGSPFQGTFLGETIGVGSARRWQEWRKPLGATMIGGWMLGGGGGGAAGETGLSTAARSGGGGGSSGSLTKFVFPAFAIPDLLYFSLGAGGLGAAQGATNGEVGTATFLSYQPDTTTVATILATALAGTAGTQVAGGGGGGGGANPGAPTTTGIGVFLVQGGGAGGNGGTSVGVGVGSTWGGTIPFSGGAGGGGADNTGAVRAGGAIISPNVNFFGTLPAPATAGGVGSSGIAMNGPHVFGFTGGVGGASDPTGVGGAGGNAAHGCGGAGGGAGTTGGAGGNGGPGILVIVAW